VHLRVQRYFEITWHKYLACCKRPRPLASMSGSHWDQWSANRKSCPPITQSCIKGFWNNLAKC
jgi:hypothetical protein